MKIEFDDRIKEISFGDDENKKLGEGILNKDIATLFFTDPFNFPGFPNGEDIHQVCNRTQSFLKELIAKDDDKTYLIVTHGCALRGMLNFLYNKPEDYWHVHVPYNLCVNIVEAKGDNVKLIADDKIYYDKELCIDRYKSG